MNDARSSIQKGHIAFAFARLLAKSRPADGYWEIVSWQALIEFSDVVPPRLKQDKSLVDRGIVCFSENSQVLVSLSRQSLQR